MKVVIIEDEHIAAKALENILMEVAPEIEILTVLQTVDESIEWFESHAAPDLLFVDIHLADGSSFTIFEKTEIKCPVIFSTAYDEYALKAFEVNSIDYLLKPIDKAGVERALGKLSSRKHLNPDANTDIMEKLMATMREMKSVYKSSLLVGVRDKLIPVPVKEIAYIHTENKIVRAVLNDGHCHTLDYTIEELVRMIDPAKFFRTNRQYIVSRSAIKDISTWFGSRLSVNLHVQTPERIYVSRATVKEFKQWITE